MANFTVRGMFKRVSVKDGENEVLVTEAAGLMRPKEITIDYGGNRDYRFSNPKYSFGKGEYDILKGSTPVAHVQIAMGFKNSVRVTVGEQEKFFLNGNSFANTLVRGNGGVLFRAVVPVVYKLEVNGEQKGVLKGKLGKTTFEVQDDYFNSLSSDDKMILLSILRFAGF